MAGVLGSLAGRQVGLVAWCCGAAAACGTVPGVPVMAGVADPVPVMVSRLKIAVSW
jgi:hypothetical protein